MHKSRLLFLSIIALVASFVLAGCSSVANLPIIGKYPMTLRDSYDREVRITRLPKRIISLAPSNTEIVFALGLGDRVVGVTEVDNYPAEVASIEKVGGFQGPNMEKILAAKPDLVLADSLTGEEVVNQLTNAGIAVLAIRSDSVADVLAHIELVGQALDAGKVAQQLVAEMQARLDAVGAKIKDLPESEKPLLYYEIWNDPLLSAGPNTFVNELIAQAGGRNVMADALSPWPEVSLESLIEKNPDVIVCAHFAQSVDDVKARANWQTVSAIKNGRVFVLDAVQQDIFNRPGPRIIEAVEALAKMLHPELFEE